MVSVDVKHHVYLLYYYLPLTALIVAIITVIILPSSIQLDGCDVALLPLSGPQVSVLIKLSFRKPEESRLGLAVRR